MIEGRICKARNRWSKECHNDEQKNTHPSWEENCQAIFKESLQKVQANIQGIRDGWTKESCKKSEQIITCNAQEEKCQVMEPRNKKILTPINLGKKKVCTEEKVGTKEEFVIQTPNMSG